MFVFHKINTKWSPRYPKLIPKWSLGNHRPSGHQVATNHRWLPTNQLVTRRPLSYPNAANYVVVTKLFQIDPKLVSKWPQNSNGKVAWKRLIRGYKGKCGQQVVTKRPPFYLTVVTKQSPIDPNLVTKRSPIGHELIGKWPPCGHQLINWSPSDHRVILKKSTSGYQLISKWSKCGHQTAINVVWKQQAIPKWFQSLKWSTSAYKKVTKRPSWNLKVVPKWSQSSQQMIQKWSPSNHQITKQQPNGS